MAPPLVLAARMSTLLVAWLRLKGAVPSNCNPDPVIAPAVWIAPPTVLRTTLPVPANPPPLTSPAKLIAPVVLVNRLTLLPVTEPALVRFKLPF